MAIINTSMYLLHLFLDESVQMSKLIVLLLELFGDDGLALPLRFELHGSPNHIVVQTFRS